MNFKHAFDLLTANAETEMRGELLQSLFIATLQKPGAEPKWNLIFPRGTWHGPNFEKLGGSFTVDDPFMSEIVANWQAAGKPRLPVRWGHEHLQTKDPEKARALQRKAGNVIDLRISAAGVEGLTEWNDEGARDVTSGVVDGWSAEWAPRHVNRLTGAIGGWFLSGVALTNEPYFNLMPRVAASAGAESTHPTPTKETSMEFTKEQLELLRATYGLAANATAAEITAAAVKAGTTLKASADNTEASINAAVQKHVEPLKTQLEAATKRGTDLEAQLLERDVDTTVTVARRGDGKLGRAITEVHIARAKRIAKEEGLKASTDYLNELPLSVPQQGTGVRGSDAISADGLTASAANEKLTIIANEMAAKGVKSPMEAALATNPELARIAQSLTSTSQR